MDEKPLTVKLIIQVECQTWNDPQASINMIRDLLKVPAVKNLEIFEIELPKKETYPEDFLC